MGLLCRETVEVSGGQWRSAELWKWLLHDAITIELSI